MCWNVNLLDSCIIHIQKKSELLMAVMTLIFMIKMQECATVYFLFTHGNHLIIGVSGSDGYLSG